LINDSASGDNELNIILSGKIWGFHGTEDSYCARSEVLPAADMNITGFSDVPLSSLVYRY
jgi:hypothetical protein